jgi:hypothetical protein
VSAWTSIPYSADALRLELGRKSHDASAVARKLHCVYFEEYFAALGARTILVEEEYVDRDFLEDFAAYYVRCFPRYERYCRRLHFFSRDISLDDFGRLLEGDRQQEGSIRENYLGFIVVKPLPETVVGRTCLKTYSTGDGRSYPITRTNKVHLFGVDLEVQTLAFQEQDRAAAACATSALWSAFQATAMVFQHHIPSPVEITQSATERAMLAGRVLPNDGLTLEQMADGIRRVGLESLVLSAADPYILRSIVYSYCSGGVPVLLIGDILDCTNPAKPRTMGAHAVAATGFHLAGQPAVEQLGGVALRSSRIDKLYCHDDQVGPFARMIFSAAGPAGSSLSTSWRNGRNEVGHVWMEPKVAMVPLYHKIRVRLPWVLEHVAAFDRLLQFVRNLFGQANQVPGLHPVEWDVSLTTVDEIKRDHHAGPPYPGRRAFLEHSLPRFLWRARGIQNGTTSLDILFDATDIERSNCCICVVELDPGIGAILRKLWAAGGRARALLEQKQQWWRIAQCFVSP